MITQQQYNDLMSELAEIKRILICRDDPANYVATSEKAEVLKRAIATGNRANIKAAIKKINGVTT